MATYNGYLLNPYHVSTRQQYQSQSVIADFSGFGSRSIYSTKNGLIVDFDGFGTITNKTVTGYYLKNAANFGTRKGTKSGYKYSVMRVGSKTVRDRIGYKYANYFVGTRSHVRKGLYLNAYHFDSNMAGLINLLVTPTFTYNNSSITVQATISQPITGKFSFYVGSTLVIPPASSSSNIANLSFTLPLSSLAIGDNTCKIVFIPDGATSTYVKFVVTSEDLNRQVSARTIFSYTGGFNLNNVKWYKKIGESFFSVYKQGQNGTVQTTSINNIDLTKASGILGVNISGLVCKYLVSLDGRQTWQAFNGTSWAVMDPADISTQGMTETSLQAITYPQWMQIFQKTSIDFLVYMECSPLGLLPEMCFTASNTGYSDYGSTYSKSGTLTPSSSITELAYQEIILTTGGTSDGSISGTLTLTGNYSQGSQTMYSLNLRKNLSVDDIVLYSPLLRFTNVSYILSEPYHYSGQLSLTCNGYGYTNPYLSSITVLLPPNYAPQISNVALTPATTHTDSTLTAHIKDVEGDPATYCVSVNGTVLQNWTGTGSEYDISVTIPSSITNIGTNAISIETYDGVTYGTPYTTYLTKIDTKPSVSGVLDKLNFTAILSDADSGDTVNYRILVNGVVKIDWTSYAAPPVNIHYTIDPSDVIVGYQNTLTLEAQDNLGQAISVDFDFVGTTDQKRRFSFIL